jgi:hypothetical protein
MASTVIDSLVVLLGLDASGYKKGRETAEKETGETARKAKSSADQITKSLTEVGRTVAGLFLGFESATGFAKWLGSLNAGEAALGRTAANIGMGAHELNRWGKATELAGGSATDAQAAFTQLTDEAQKFFVSGEASPLIKTLQQYGVNIRGANGELRNQGEIFEELADKTAVYGRQYQNFILKQAGITQGEINYLALTKQGREDNLRLAESTNAVSEESVRQAQKMQQYWRHVGDEIEAAGQLILSAITPTMTQLLAIFGDVNVQSEQFTAGLKFMASTAIVIKNVFGAVGDVLGNVAAQIGALLHGDFKGALHIFEDLFSSLFSRAKSTSADVSSIWNTPAATGAATVARSGEAGAYVPPPGSKAARFNNPGNILDKQGNERRYATPEEGAAALENDLRIKMQRGLKTVDAIITAYEGGDNVRNNIPAYIADVQKRLGKNDLTEADIKQLARAMSIHESGPSARVTPAAGNTTTVSVGAIHVNSPNADPRAVADQVPAAIQRKFSVSQSDTGQS